MELRYTDTNAGTDSAGRAFGLEGNLYLPLLLAGLAGIGLVGCLILIWQVRWPVVVAIAIAPLALVILWILLLKRGRPAGFDRDWLEHVCGQGHFTRVDRDQEVGS